MHFEALTDFWSEELKSQYVKGMTYQVRPGNDTLAGLIPAWVESKKIRIIGILPSAAGLQGSGG